MTTRVFISWSGNVARDVARVLSPWLQDVIQACDPFMSEDALPKGIGWPNELRDALSEARFGIVIVTPENMSSQWLHFEAGALAVAFEGNRVTPFLIGTSPADLDGPLRLFNAVTEPTKAEVRRLVDSLNAAIAAPLESALVSRAFERMWPELERDLQPILERASASAGAKPTSEGEQREDRILNRIDALERQVASQGKQALSGKRTVSVASVHKRVTSALLHAGLAPRVEVFEDDGTIVVRVGAPVPPDVKETIRSSFKEFPDQIVLQEPWPGTKPDDYLSDESARQPNIHLSTLTMG